MQSLADPYSALGALAQVINIVLHASGALIAVLAFLYLILGGFYYLTAGDNYKSLAKARQTILWAIIGLIIGVSVYGITSFIAGAIPGGLPGITPGSGTGTTHCTSAPSVVGTPQCKASNQTTACQSSSTWPSCPAGTTAYIKTACIDCSLTGACCNLGFPFECTPRVYCE